MRTMESHRRSMTEQHHDGHGTCAPASRFPSAPRGTDAAPTSRSSRRSPNASSCACSIATVARRASTCPSERRSAGTPICAASVPDSATGFACTARGIRPAGIGATRRSCWSIRMPAPSPATSNGTRRCSPIRSAATIFSATSDDNAAYMPKAVVVDDAFDWEGDRPLRRKLHETVIYEVHLKGFTKQHPDIPEAIRGTYAGLAHPAALEYLSALGVTAVELLPIHQFVHELHLLDKGLRNYWGYHSYGYFAPHGEYSSQGDCRRTGPRVQADGEGAPRGRTRSDPRRGLQPHRRRQPSRPDAEPEGHRQSRVLPHGRERIPATTWTTPAPATASTCGIRTR